MKVMKIEIALIVFLLLPFVTLAEEQNNSSPVITPFGFLKDIPSPRQDIAQAADKPARNLVAKENSSAGKRIALVIGNGNYQHSDSLPKLDNPPHDAKDIAKALRNFGFEVIEKKDQSLEGMSDAIAEFGRKIGDSEAALFYFAGHGLQVKGQNYLIPVDAKIESEAQVCKGRNNACPAHSSRPHPCGYGRFA